MYEEKALLKNRDVLAHGYFQADPNQLYSICKNNIPLVIETLKKIIQDLNEAI